MYGTVFGIDCYINKHSVEAVVYIWCWWVLEVIIASLCDLAFGFVGGSAWHETEQHECTEEFSIFEGNHRGKTAKWRGGWFTFLRLAPCRYVACSTAQARVRRYACQRCGGRSNNSRAMIRELVSSFLVYFVHSVYYLRPSFSCALLLLVVSQIHGHIL